MKTHILTDVFIDRPACGTICILVRLTPKDGGQPYTYQMPFTLGGDASDEAYKFHQLAMKLKNFLDQDGERK